MGRPQSAPRKKASRWSRLPSQKTTRAFWRWLFSSTLAFVDSILGYCLAAAVLAAAMRGALRADIASSTTALVVVAALTLHLLFRLWQRTSRRGRSAAKDVADVELATVLIAATFALLEVSGGPRSMLYPVVYGLVAFVVATLAAVPSVGLLLLICGAEAGLTYTRGTAADWVLCGSHLGFNALFAALSALFLRTEVRARRSQSTREVEDYLEEIKTAALEFRLTSGLSHAGTELSVSEIAQRRQVGSVEAIKQALYNVLGVAEHALAPHTIALLWLDASDRHLKIKELRSQSDYITEHPIAAGEGVCGAIVKRKEPLVLTNLKAGHAALTYYERPPPITDFIGVPVLDGTFLRGLLVADRIDGQPFNEADIALLCTVAHEIIRTVEVERVFVEMDHDKYQKEHFYEASSSFNQALNVKGVAETAIAAAKRVAQVDFAALVVSSEKENHMRIEAIAATSEKMQSFVGREINAEHGLVGAAIKARHVLPHGSVRTSSEAVFGHGLALSYPAVKIFPLIARDQGVGALVLASTNESFLPPGTLDMVKVIANHAAIALANAQLFEHNERLATTDGLTGLYNHRQFQRIFDQRLAQAERYSRKLSVLLSDIDHFKSVNDTYGHPVGDQVLKRVAAILAESARARIDTVARYGGEEFVVLLPETDRDGALRLAERIRETVADEPFFCTTGKFRTTLSLGIATFPLDATNKAKLIDCADKALYAAKGSGRNRCIAFSSLRTQREVSTEA